MPALCLFLALWLGACNTLSDPQSPVSPAPPAPVVPARVGDIPLPSGYVRIKAGPHSYAAFLRMLLLKKDRTVYLYNGHRKHNQRAQYAVLALDVGDKDLQQCADAVMRLRAEYLLEQQQSGAIAFRFSNGFLCDYQHYAEGYRLAFKGNQCAWVKQQPADRSYQGFRRYLDLVYSYAGTRSLYSQLKPVPFASLTSGQVLIQTGEPYGHAVTVMDIACHPGTGDTIFLLSQSYMPAQDIHILRNPMDPKLSPWYSMRTEGDIYTPEWAFSKEDLRAF